MVESLENVESALFGRMLKNAIVGFVKAAGIAAAVGAATGALLATFGFLDPFLPSALVQTTGPVLAGAIAGAATCIVPGGAIGATAGIQSTRDARRYLHIHEADRADALLPPELDKVASVMPEIHAEKTVSHTERLESQAQGAYIPRL